MNLALIEKTDMKPLFAVGETVLHKSKYKYGIVQQVFDTVVGPRYYVRHSGWLWSVPEQALQTKKSTEKPQENQIAKNDESDMSDSDSPTLPRTHPNV